MLNLHVTFKSVAACLFRSVLLSLIFIFYLPSSASGQTIFDYAVELDSLYDRLRATDETAAEPFFEVFREVTGAGSYVPVLDFTDNVSGLSEEINYAYKLYKLSKRLEADSLSIFKYQRDSLGDIVYSLLNISRYQVEGVVNSGGRFQDVVSFHGDDLDTKPDSIYREVVLLMIRIERLDDKIDEYEGRKSGASGLSQKEEALDAFPIVTESTGAVGAPIIIQNQVGGSAQSAIIDGTAKWIAERMRQELNIAFFDRFETWAENKNIALVFPNTISVLKSSATTDYTLMMEIYKRAFQNDLHQLTFNIPAFLENEIIDQESDLLLKNQIAQLGHEIDEQYHLHVDIYEPDAELSKLLEQRAYYQDKLKRQQFIKYLRLSLQTINQLQEGQHPSILLNSLQQQSYELFPENDRLQSVILLLNTISQSLIATNTEKNTVWMGKDLIRQLQSDAQLRKFYFGLLVLKIQTEISKRQQKQAIITNNAIPENQRNVITEKLKSYEKEYKDFQVFLGGNYTFYELKFDLDNTSDANACVDDYLKSFHLPDSSRALNREQLERYRDNFQYSDYYRLLVDAKAFRINDLKLELGYADYKLYDQDIIKSNYIGYFYGRPVPEDFFYHCQKEKSFEAAKTAYFERISYSSVRGDYIHPELKTDSVFNHIDSINDIRLRGRYAFYEKYFKSQSPNDPDRLFGNYKRSIKQGILKKDSIDLIYLLDVKDPAFQRAKYQMRQLNEQRDFLHDFILGDYRTEVPEVSNLFNDFVQYANKIDQINTQFKELRSKGQANFGNEEFIYLIKNSMGVLDIIFDYTLDKENPKMIRNMKTVQFATDNLLDAYIAGLSEDYNGVITHIIPVVERLVAEKYDKLIQPMEEEARGSMSEKQLSLGFLPRSVALDSLRLLRDDKIRKMQEVFKYCAFIAAVAKSTNSDDVKKAINAIALPVGSYSIKRRTYANISLNAYPGITGGFELVQNNNFSEWAPNFGFTAPIGIGINWGYRSKINERRYLRNMNYRNRVQKAEVGVDDRIFNGHSGSFFFSFVDLGALVLFRLNDSNEPLPEDVGIKQIFSPGVAYVHGLPRVPISIMAGAQLTPDLRKVGEGENIEAANSFRFNISIVVDLPIANFYTRRRPKR